MAVRPGPQSLNGDATASDEALAARASALGDEDAFAALMQRHQRRIFYLHKRLCRDAAVAEELAQETFLRAWRKLDRFAGTGSFGGWLSRLAYNVFLQQRRRERSPPAAQTVDPADSAEAREALLVTPAATEPELERLLAVVSPPERELLILNYAGGLSNTEIGAMLGLAPGTVKSQIHRAKQKIRAHFHIEAES